MRPSAMRRTDRGAAEKPQLAADYWLVGGADGGQPHQSGIREVAHMHLRGFGVGKEIFEFAVEQVLRNLDAMGFKSIVLKTDPENPITVKRRWQGDLIIEKSTP